jgi:hypothetical protein
MIDWLVKNRDWVFSGIGVLVLTIGWQFIAAWRGNSSSLERVSKTESSLGEPTSLSALEIHSAIGNAPPLQRDAVAKNYAGIRVRWDTLLISATPRGKEVRLQLRNADEKSQGSPTIWCHVDLGKYPELAVVAARAKIQVVGTIVKAEYFSVDLKAVELRIVAQPAPQ